MVTPFEKTRSDPVNQLYCGGAHNAAGCLGYYSEQRQADVAAWLWDLDRVSRVSRAADSTAGRDRWIGYGLPIPIFLDRTLTQACDRVAGQLIASLGEDARR